MVSDVWNELERIIIKAQVEKLLAPELLPPEGTNARERVRDIVPHVLKVGFPVVRSKIMPLVCADAERIERTVEQQREGTENRVGSPRLCGLVEVIAFFLRG